jgi:hypothetical protein
MAMHVAPQRGNAVDVFATIQVHQDATMSALDDSGPFAGVSLHGSERMPNMLPIPLFQLLA